MSYDNWKANNPQDAELGTGPDDDEPNEPGQLNRGMCYDRSRLHFKGWLTPVGFRHSLEGYQVDEYFEGPFSGPARYLGPDSFGVEPLFESI